jgi:hypothetical protein
MSCSLEKLFLNHPSLIISLYRFYQANPVSLLWIQQRSVCQLSESFTATHFFKCYDLHFRPVATATSLSQFLIFLKARLLVCINSGSDIAVRNIFERVLALGRRGVHGIIWKAGKSLSNSETSISPLRRDQKRKNSRVPRLGSRRTTTISPISTLSTPQLSLSFQLLEPDLPFDFGRFEFYCTVLNCDWY